MTLYTGFIRFLQARYDLSHSKKPGVLIFSKIHFWQIWRGFHFVMWHNGSSEPFPVTSPQVAACVK